MSVVWASLSPGWVVGLGGFRPNLLSLLFLIEIRIMIKLGCDNNNYSVFKIFSALAKILFLKWSTLQASTPQC